MTAIEILKAGPELLGDNFEAGFRALAREWHPDVCRHKAADEVFAHLVALRHARAGAPAAQETLDVPGGQVVLSATDILLVSPWRSSVLSYLAEARKASDIGKRTLPAEVVSESVVKMPRPLGTVSMATVLRKYPSGLPPHHAAWMSSRLFELVYRLDAAGYTWNGLLPVSMLVLVKEHGVLPLDPRFIERRGAKMAIAPAPLVPLLPPSRKATAQHDLACVHRAALVLLGDPSGTGNALLRTGTVPRPLLDWFRSRPGTDPAEHYRSYRDILTKVFGPPKYHELEV